MDWSICPRTPGTRAKVQSTRTGCAAFGTNAWRRMSCCLWCCQRWKITLGNKISMMKSATHLPALYLIPTGSGNFDDMFVGMATGCERCSTTQSRDGVWSAEIVVSDCAPFPGRRSLPRSDLGRSSRSWLPATWCPMTEKLHACAGRTTSQASGRNRSWNACCLGSKAFSSTPRQWTT